MTNRKKILISAYACEPELGSEIGVGWHWALELAKEFEVWVVTRASNRKRIENYTQTLAQTDKNHDFDHDYDFDHDFDYDFGHDFDHDYDHDFDYDHDYDHDFDYDFDQKQEPSIHFVYYDLPQYMRWWKKGRRGIHLYYQLWQIGANRLIHKTMQENNIRLFHHITYGNALWQVSPYGQKQTFIWGPIGGLERIPKGYMRPNLKEWIRECCITMVKYNPAFRLRCKRANIILCKTQATLQALPLSAQQKAILLTDVATDPITVTPTNTPKETQTLLSVGHLDAWRGFDLCLHALYEIKQTQPNLSWQYRIVGSGKDKPRLQHLVQQLQLTDNVQFIGEVSKTAYYQELAQADIVLNTNLKEGGVSVAMDALTFGKPLIALETGGYTQTIQQAAIILSPTTPKETIHEIAQHIVNLQDKSVYQALSQAALQRSQTLTWEKKGEQIRQICNL